MKLIVEQGDEHFYMWKSIGANGTALKVTNFKQLWQVILTEKDILDRFKEDNPLVQAKPEWILKHFCTCVDSEVPCATLKVEENLCVLGLKDPSKEIKVKSNFVLHLLPNEQFYKDVTFPLTAVISVLMDQRTKLINIIRAKDEELKEYKLEGASIARRNVETDEFNEKEFLSSNCQECVEKIRSSKAEAQLNVTPDLSNVFSEASKLSSETSIQCKEDPPPSPTSPTKDEMSPSKSVLKRPKEIQKIVQVPRTKQRKKHFNL